MGHGGAIVDLCEIPSELHPNRFLPASISNGPGITINKYIKKKRNIAERNIMMTNTVLKKRKLGRSRETVTPLHTFFLPIVWFYLIKFEAGLYYQR